LFRKIQSKPPIIPLLTEKLSENPITIHRIDKMARPEKHCIITEREFLLRRRPASKNPNAGVMIITKPVETSSQEVSPVFMSDKYFIVPWNNEIVI
jgi:hypothetical protein